MQSAVQHDGSLQHAGGPEDSQKVWIRVHPSRGQGEQFGGGSASRRVRRDSGGDNDWWRSKYKWSGGKGDQEGNITDEEDVHLGAAKCLWPAGKASKRFQNLTDVKGLPEFRL